jgi:hypothetical protein
MKESFILQNIYIKYWHSQELLPLHETYIYTRDDYLKKKQGTLYSDYDMRKTS